MFDGEQFGQQMVEIVRGYVDSEVGPLKAENVALRSDLQQAIDANAALVERVAALEARELPEAIKGDPGEVDMEAVGLLLDEKLAVAISTIPAPTPATLDMVEISGLIDKAVAERPLPQDGKDCDMDAVKAYLVGLVDSAVKSVPAGKDGLGLASALKDERGHLIIVLSDGTTQDLGQVNGKDGKTFTLEDFDIVPVDERTIKMGFTNGDTLHSFELSFPVLIGRGLWSEDGDYERGDVTTWGGTAWEAVEPVKGVKPDGSSGGWRILAKRGRDGKDAK